MLGVERQLYILNQVNTVGKVTIAELAKQLKVSLETIRRDLNTLEEEGKIKKVHGGAIKSKKSLFEQKYVQRTNLNREKKVQCGEVAAKYIKDNDVIAIDCGTTTVEILKVLSKKKNLTIITHSITALNILIDKIENGDITGRIIFLGGYVDTEHYNTEGFFVEKQLEELYIDKLFFGATALAENGIMAYDPNEGRISGMYISHSNQRYLVMDSSKMGANSVYKIGDIKDVDYLITDREFSSHKQLKNKCIEQGVKIIMPEEA